MNRINWEFSHRFGGHWIKVKFYNEKPDTNGIKRIEGVRFCEAKKEAIIHPVILYKESIPCKSAHCVAIHGKDKMNGYRLKMVLPMQWIWSHS